MDKNPDLYVVGIGASAGGLDAIQQFFDAVPTNSGCAFVIIQHLSPDFKSLMPELLAKHTKLPIYTAADKQELKPNCIYLNSRNKNLHLKGNKLYLLDKGPKHNLNLPIDIFFHTLGEEFKEKSIGVILSGTGSDGSRGIKTIKEAGGTVIVQDPNSAQFDGMPNSAVSGSIVDYVVEPLAMFKSIAKSIRQYPVSKDDLEDENKERVFDQILNELNKVHKVDFKKYKKNTLIRRMEKRMNITNANSIDKYLKKVKNNKDEVDILHQDFLIGVTSFFRDEEAYKVLKNTVIPEIFRNAEKMDVVRIWVPGCSTGEEAYSVAMLMDDYIRTNQLNIDFKIFATDVDNKALAIAGSGVFDVNIANELDTYYLQNYFIKTGNKFHINKRLREKIVFSYHNLLSDPPFIRLDLVTCRNLLIYLNGKTQDQVIYSFQFALKKNGFLFLGNSESLGEAADLFKTVDLKWKVYQNISESKHFAHKIGGSHSYSRVTYPQSYSGGVKSVSKNPNQFNQFVFDSYLSERFSPASLFIDADYNILFAKGDAGKRLKFGNGIFSNNLLDLVDQELAAIIQTGIRNLDVSGKDVIINNVKTGTNDNASFDLSFHKVKDTKLENVILVHFSTDYVFKEEAKVLSNVKLDEASKERILDLEYQLKHTQTELQNVVEELETSNEELQSSNEELMASNEELQSTNEELQSVNEELYTVNAEIQEKNKEFQIVNNDISNLLDNTDIGTLFLDKDLRIRKFTKGVKQIFNLEDTDVGRPISSFASKVSVNVGKLILDNGKEVIDNLKPFEQEVNIGENISLLMRIIPFITIDKRIDGLVLTFVDISNVKEAERKLLESKQRYQILFDNMTEGFAHAKLVFDNNGNPVDWEYINVNDAFEKLTGIRKDFAVGKSGSVVIPGVHKDKVDWLGLFADTALNGTKHEIMGESKALGNHYLVNTFQPEHGEWAATFTNITERVETEKRIELSQERLNEAQAIADMGYFEHSFTKDTLWWSDNLYRIFGFEKLKAPPPFIDFVKQLNDSDAQKLQVLVNNAMVHGEGYETFYVYQMPKTGNKKFIQVNANVVFEDSKPIGLKGVAVDVTKEKLAETELKRYNLIVNTANDVGNIGIFEIDLHHDELIYSNTNFNNIFRLLPKGVSKQLHGIIQVNAKAKKQLIKKLFVGNLVNKTLEFEIVDPITKNKKWVSMVCQVSLRSDEGSAIRLVGASLDLTERKRYENELIEAKQKAELGNTYKNQFLANLSHEIRTPMNGIVGFTELLDTNELSEEKRKKYINNIRNGSTQLLRIIDDIVDVSRIEAGEMSLISGPCKLNDLFASLEQTLNQIKVQKGKKQLVLNLQLPKEDHIIDIDSNRLFQIISNLVNNSIKYSNEGEITFGYKIRDKNWIEFFVMDEGIGIPSEKLEVIFNRFEQIKSDSSTLNDGNGLGLAIVEGLVHLMGGELMVVSEQGKGCEFKVMLPYSEAQKVKQRSKRAYLGKKLNDITLLVADDEPMNVELIQSLLENEKVKVIMASDGKEALEAYKANEEIDLVFLDVRMPVMDGTRALKEILKLNPSAKVIAQTAFAMANDDLKFINMGFIDYITKPIDKVELFDKIKKNLAIK